MAVSTWPVASTVEFYRRTLRLDWLEIKGRHVDKSEADYYILALEERTLADKLQVLFRDDAAEVLLARPMVPPVRT